MHLTKCYRFSRFAYNMLCCRCARIAKILRVYRWLSFFGEFCHLTICVDIELVTLFLLENDETEF